MKIINRIAGIVLIFLLTTSCGNNEKIVQAPGESEIKIVFTGDVLLGRFVEKRILKSGADSIFSNVSDIFRKADYTVINLECPVSEIETPVLKKYVFNGRPEYLESFSKSGITHCIMANNHSYDQGRQGLKNTYEELIKHNLVPVGFGDNHKASCKPVIIEKNGIRAALFASVRLPLENWVFLEDRPCPCQASIDELCTGIKEYKVEHPEDFILVSLHWGVENRIYPHPGQIKDAKRLINAGADAIIGHHPHVIQKMMFIEGKPVFFSIGNFVFDNSSPRQKKTVAVELTLKPNKEIKSKLYPVYINNCFPELMAPGMNNSFLHDMRELSNSVEFMENGAAWEITGKESRDVE